MKKTAQPADTDACEPPKIWSNLWARPANRHSTECDCDCADCVCDACSDTGAQAQTGQRTQQIAWRIARGEIRSAAFTGDGFFTSHGSQWVAVPARGSYVAVMAEEWGAFLESRRGVGPMSVETYREGLGNEIFVQVMAVLIDHGILTSPEAEEPQPTRSGGMFSAWLHLTDQCNLRCAYCYVPKGSRHMTEEIARQAARVVFQSAQAHGFSSVKLKYAGGEPTLNFAALVAAQQEAETQAGRTGLRLDSVMLTNGFRLADSQVTYLLAHNIRVMLSLDGPRATHDRNRPAAYPAASSHDRAIDSIDRLMAWGIMPHISITLTRLNLESAAELVRDEILGRELSFSLNFYRPAAGAASSEDPLLCPPDALVRGMRAIYEAIADRLPRRRIFDNLVDRAHPGRAYPFACGAGRQYLVINCDGGIAPCQMEIRQPVAHLADPNPMAAIRKWGAEVLGGTASACAACPWRNRCAGGCPRLTLSGGKSPLCAVYRELLPAAVHLEAERLLRYENPIPLL